MSSAHIEEQRRKTEEWMKRVEGRSGSVGSNYWRVWPILIAPVIPLIGIAFKNQPRTRNALMAITGGGVLIYGFGWAITGSSDVTGG
ncbi:hypothetical protein C2E20_1756 [Micractinium conductrix]|uniref:Uncharacterized protein n=1 Tax=Micractinium conductrix TaxID=554055 RepID=A0A2P6VLQ3_9CHLO|nr:hypothetical protein C2E20_1756 [Micractinium conductrix]|eukprot:PSC75023.1 hypothetical protein C2E20_1756 [Micractinium conductrix]